MTKKPDILRDLPCAAADNADSSLGIKRGLTAPNPMGAKADRIDTVYSELGNLMRQSADADDPDLEKVVELKFAHLRQLQQAEAAAMRQRFEARLHLPPGSGWAALEKAQSLLKSNEDSSPADGSSSRRD